ncbi:NAD(P)H-dependent oxidoreductase [Salinibacterium sp. dk2585]|uniref:NADPH-dependent FMN reductase n=1 Tax=unclassified Salinibacterium TaxID=2632331 RepID=UPI0011C24C07|nr:MULTISPECIES: NAD(P)H-dependent oxidoreductase [unclassified Salinibacterium]QEE60238.1 NAD(P)H-dependent oxidoreductase [Salinibacterium sp. dk2585]TXK55310.1 NAD(P)H-dependent oxidoreductase [Salinibacterium sp. dk5596]
MSDLKIGIIVGSTRPGRLGRMVGDWVEANAAAEGVEFELVDLHDYKLPLLEEAYPAGAGNYQGDAANAWASKIGEFDGYLFVTGEYNHSIPGALKNALDYVAAEWNNKAAGIVSYGSMGGVRAGEHLRQVLGELQIADVRQHVMLSLFTDFSGMAEGAPAFTPAENKAEELQTQVSQVVAWANALRAVRVAQETVAA